MRAPGGPPETGPPARAARHRPPLRSLPACAGRLPLGCWSGITCEVPDQPPTPGAPVTAVPLRLLRATAVVVAVVGSVVVAGAEAAQAHGVAAMTVQHNGHGAVSVTVQWQDGHQIGEAVTVALSATSGKGEKVGPVPLRALRDPAGTLVLDQPLAVGQWAVVASLSTPVVVRCEVVVPVVAAAQPVASPPPQRCVESSAPTAGSAIPRRDIRDVTLAVVGGGVAVALVLAVVVFFFLRPPRPARVPSRVRRR